MINIYNKASFRASKIHLKELRNKILNSPHLNDLPNYLKNFIISKIDDILIGDPKKLSRLNTHYYKLQRSRHVRKYDSVLKKIFSFSNFNTNKKEYNLNNLSENISIKYCPYCNRQSTINVTSNSIKPDFDHYFPQAKFPLLGLSFYNLIPCCTICNSRFKIGKVLRLNQYLHPYVDDCMNDFNFTYKYDISSKNLIKIDIKRDILNPLPTKIEKSLSLFKIIETYNAHTDEILDLLKIKQIYNDRYLKILSTQTFSDLKISQEELYRLAFGVYYEKTDFSKRPFSKLKKDILTELNLIR
ncbi:hypothetical protein [Flavobacterium stagni]|uniref:HNH domain-containing protein n=1 Tax=Flavobacterium stagni TaxID=2506421 RepID=A0A4Q1K4W7_9FLAO|nr:hypothetical protein [Flavobacterium stagni]RXR20194.1 hypothetical protein EQG61_13165 [Flavobacterium stagni]